MWSFLYLVLKLFCHRKEMKTQFINFKNNSISIFFFNKVSKLIPFLLRENNLSKILVICCIKDSSEAS